MEQTTHVSVDDALVFAYSSWDHVTAIWSKSAWSTDFSFESQYYFLVTLFPKTLTNRTCPIEATGFQPTYSRDLDLLMFKMTYPILGTRDIHRAIEFYIQRLGFQLAFGDKTDPPNYVGFRRDAVELHMQFQFEHEMSTTRLRFLVEDPDALFNEYTQNGVECSSHGIHDTPWGTREFALYDLDRNALTFYNYLA